jgi:uncharacterized protein YprB with RNaseH-like and TPR domain
MNLAELRARLGPPSSPPSAPVDRDGLPIERCVPGREIAGSEGPSFVVDSVRSAAQAHGRYTYQELWRVPTLRLPSPGPRPEPVDINLRSTAFIDTETTGLGYGVGTHVFMVGVGWLDGDAFVVRQFFLRHPGEETAMLAALAEHLAPFESVVSYNGRSFDWPLLENRFVMRRIHPAPLINHFDLLYLTRRLWKLRIDSCSMGSIENAILGFRRTQDDVDGWMIPQLYFQYLRTGNAKPLRRVFYHNLHDILSLAMLAAYADKILQDPWCGLVAHPLDYFSLGKLYAGMGEIDQGVTCLEHALQGGLPPRLESEALLRLALIEKRRQNWDGALPLFEQVVQRPGFQRIACVEMAKYHEHVARDHREAMSLTIRALRGPDYPPMPSWPGTTHMELHHRRRRLVRRLEGLEAAYEAAASSTPA